MKYSNQKIFESELSENVKEWRRKYSKFRLWSSGLWHHAVLYVTTNISEEHTASTFRIDSMFLQNAGNHLEDYMVSQPKRPQSELLLLWKPQVPWSIQSTHHWYSGPYVSFNTTYITKATKIKVTVSYKMPVLQLSLFPNRHLLP